MSTKFNKAKFARYLFLLGLNVWYSEVWWKDKYVLFTSAQLLFLFYLVPLFTARCLDLAWFLYPKQNLFLFKISFGIILSCFWDVYHARKKTKSEKEQFVGMNYMGAPFCLVVTYTFDASSWIHAMGKPGCALYRY